MNKILIIILASLQLVIVGCNDQQKDKQLIHKQGATENLEQVIDKLKSEGGDITPAIAFDAITEIYNSNSEINETSEKPIDLYVIYDTDYWVENNRSETFEITFAHQVVEEPNGALYEYRITMIYDTKPFEGMEEFDLRYPRDKDNLDLYKEAIRKSDGFKKASSVNVNKIEIIKEEI